ncbi:hypothetical protein C8T65DRAFT_664229 [Cerioporus squamosus]|nr:hypothetical protein C8T65DRAFT_673213 [Cerioporus squamosus]KAI0696142.1 hypothetical protein C8T65DRAFT_664229 [Cerioporus squamosus]
MVMSAWQDPSNNDDASPSASDDEPESPDDPEPAASHGEGPDVQPPSAYKIIQPDGAGVVNLTAQHIHIRQTVRDTLPRLEAKLAFDNAFPDTITLAQDIHRTLIEVAGESGYTGLVEALRTNKQISTPVATIVRQRMSTYRGSVKKAADSHAAAFYQLRPGCGQLVTALFDFLSYSYVYTWDAAKAKLDVTWHKPYGNEIYPAILHSCFFNGPTSLASKNAHRFVSSLDLRPDEKEIPIPMLAFVGTAIHAALSEWRSGTHAHVSFSADAFLDVYNEHKLILNGIKAKNIRAFHKMMHRLYREASGAAPTNDDAAAAAANEALDHVDFANMDVDD